MNNCHILYVFADPIFFRKIVFHRSEALRVVLAVTRLTVYRLRQVIWVLAETSRDVRALDPRRWELLTLGEYYWFK